MTHLTKFWFQQVRVLPVTRFFFSRTTKFFMATVKFGSGSDNLAFMSRDCHGYGLVTVQVGVGHSHPQKTPPHGMGFMGSQSTQKKIFLGIYSLTQLLFTNVYIILYQVLLQWHFKLNKDS